MGKGFNKGEKYIQEVETIDRNRGNKFNFKLRYARKNNLPYYVIAGEEFEHLDKETNLTIVDGLIGYELAIRDFKERIFSVVKEHRDYMNNLTLHEQHEYRQDIVLDEELDAHRKCSRIIHETEKVRNKIRDKLGAYGYKMFKSQEYSYTNYPELPGTSMVKVMIFSVALWKSLKSRLKAMKNVEEVKCTYTVFDTPIGEVSNVAWMRNIGDYSKCLLIIRDIAELLAWKKILRLLQRRANWN